MQIRTAHSKRPTRVASVACAVCLGSLAMLSVGCVSITRLVTPAMPPDWFQGVELNGVDSESLAPRAEVLDAMQAALDGSGFSIEHLRVHNNRWPDRNTYTDWTFQMGYTPEGGAPESGPIPLRLRVWFDLDEQTTRADASSTSSDMTEHWDTVIPTLEERIPIAARMLAEN